MTSKADWLARLQVGDEVIVQTSRLGSKGWLTTVARFTATLIVTANNSQFRRRDGDEPGRSGYHGRWLEEPTAKARAAIRHHTLVDAMKQIPWEELPLATLEAVVELAAQARKARDDEGGDPN